MVTAAAIAGRHATEIMFPDYQWLMTNNDAWLATEIMFPDCQLRTTKDIQIETANKLKEVGDLYCTTTVLMLQTKTTLYSHPITSEIMRAIEWNMSRFIDRIGKLSQCAISISKELATWTQPNLHWTDPTNQVRLEKLCKDCGIETELAIELGLYNPHHGSGTEMSKEDMEMAKKFLPIHKCMRIVDYDACISQFLDQFPVAPLRPSGARVQGS